MPKPPFEAELRTLVEVGGTDAPDQIRVVFNKNYFEINGKDGSDTNPVLISDKDIGVKREATADSIKVKCIEGFTTQQEIKVYVYPKGTLAKPVAEQLFARKLAGKIIVLPNKNTTGQNAVKNIKEQKFVFVKVTTDIFGAGMSIGNFTPDDKNNLQKCLYQSLIYGDFEDAANNLDLSSNLDFKVGGKYVDALGKLNMEEPTFHSNLRNLFLNIRDASGGLINSRYNNYFTFFILKADSISGAPGQVEKIGVKNAVFLDGTNGRWPTTCAHEGLHGMGLLHTHRNGAITKPNQKFTFVHAGTNSSLGTDNIMSYNATIRKIIWYWQWKIIRSNV
ncbi:hypothetical protein BWK62_14940 [Flavobacterium oreochromis]|nr:hypothetical protein BWG23_15080 [Flavobacterium oreochromis]OWP74147.1 hypothetical protein BWK62_14940 [Flavobacterium oreochromis]